MKITPGTIKKLYKYNYRKGLTTSRAIDILNRIDNNYRTESWNCKDLLEAIKKIKKKKEMYLWKKSYILLNPMLYFICII